MSGRVRIAGVGMVPFTKPGKSDTYVAMGSAAIREALRDASVSYDQIGQVYAGFVYADSCAGQRVAYEVGMTGVPVINVNNNCATGSTALFLARQSVAAGAVECALAVGFEQMIPGALGLVFNDRPSPLERFDVALEQNVGQVENVPAALRYFGAAGKAHMDEYGTPLETFAAIRAKASRHAARNPLALFRKVLTTEEVMASPVIWEGVMTRLMACPPTCGAAAAIVCSEAFARKHGINATVRISAQAMTTDQPDSLNSGDMRLAVGAGIAHKAREQACEDAGIDIADVDVAEIHDCFAQNELISYEALGFCGPGEAEKFVADGDNTYGGQVVTNPSGGLLSKGHPLGATGLAQCYELTHQLRGTAGDRQVQGARIALQHNLGLGGACVVTLYEG